MLFSSIAERLNRDSFIKNVLLIAGGTAAAQLITILCTPVVTRLYTPADFGVLTVFTAILGIIGQLSTLRYSVAVPLAENENLANNILQLCFFISFFLSLIFGAVTLLFGDLFSGSLSIADAVHYSWLLPICLLGIGLYEALAAWAVRRKHFNIISRTKLSQGITSSCVKILLGWVGIKPMGLLLGFLASEIAGTGSIFTAFRREHPSFFRNMSWQGIINAAIRYRNFPLLQSWSRLLLSLGVQLPAIFMAASFGARDAGLFGLASSMVSIPMNLMGASVAQVYYSEIASYGKSKPDVILRLSISIIRKMVLVGIITIGFLALAGPWLFTIVFGAEWHDAGVYATMLSVLAIGQFVSSPIMHCLDVLEKQGLQFLLNVIRVFLVVSVFMLCAKFGFSSESTILWYSIFTFAYYVMVVTIVLIALSSAKMKRA